MNIHPRAFLIIALTVLLAGCATPSAPPPVLQRRLAPEWIASARHIESAGRTIYYRGQAHGSAANGGQVWAGTVSGEVLVLDPGMAIVVPAGVVTLTTDGRMKIAGEQQVVTSDAPAWKHLLRP